MPNEHLLLRLAEQEAEIRRLKEAIAQFLRTLDEIREKYDTPEQPA